MTPSLQFIDTLINKPFILRKRWAVRIANATEEFTKQGNCRGVSYEMVCQWLFKEV